MALCRSVILQRKITVAIILMTSAQPLECPSIPFNVLREFAGTVITSELRELLGVDHVAKLKPLDGSVCVCDVSEALSAYAHSLRSLHPDKGGADKIPSNSRKDQQKSRKQSKSEKSARRESVGFRRETGNKLDIQ